MITQWFFVLKQQRNKYPFQLQISKFAEVFVSKKDLSHEVNFVTKNCPKRVLPGKRLILKPIWTGIRIPIIPFAGQRK